MLWLSDKTITLFSANKKYGAYFNNWAQDSSFSIPITSSTGISKYANPKIGQKYTHVQKGYSQNRRHEREYHHLRSILHSNGNSSLRESLNPNGKTLQHQNRHLVSGLSDLRTDVSTSSLLEQRRGRSIQKDIPSTISQNRIRLLSWTAGFSLLHAATQS